jgi:hypothetical protein
MILLLPATLGAQESDAGFRTHVVEEGATLWGLAQAFYGDAHEWTRIFDANRDRILDPEVLPTGLELIIPSTPGSDADVTRPPPDDLRDRSAGSPVYVAGAFFRAPWLTPRDAEPMHSGTLVEFDDANRGGHSVQPFDRVRIAMKASLPAVGTRLQAFRIERDAGVIGRVVRPTGTLTVVEVTSTGVLAEAEELFGRMAVGDAVRPLPPLPVDPDRAGHPVNGGLRVRVIGFAESRPLRLPGDYLFLGAGTNGGLRAGDILESAPTDPTEGRATVHVVAVHDGYATARLSRVENPMFGIGVELGLSRRVP